MDKELIRCDLELEGIYNATNNSDFLYTLMGIVDWMIEKQYIKEELEGRRIVGEQQLDPATHDTPYQKNLDFAGMWETIDGDVIEIIGKYNNHLAYRKSNDSEEIFTIAPDKLSHRLYSREGGALVAGGGAK